MGEVHLADAMATLTLSDGKLPLENYFPPGFKIHEYNATEDKIVKTTTLNDDIKDWLRTKPNYKFIFQCLLCCQEMTFNTVFCRGDFFLNRSHLLTKKHRNNVVSAVGLLYVSSQKFIICHEKDFNSGNIFNVAKRIKRRDLLSISSNIQNKVFCSNYTMYTFNRETKTLCEMEILSDIVTFMREKVRPLFNFNCLLCNSKAASFTVVVKHLLGNKHIKKLGGGKGVIIAIKDFNIFVACDLTKLTSLLFLEHLNSYLEEIVVASEGSVIISGNHTKEGKAEPKDAGIQINVNPIQLPNGETKDKSIKIQTRFHNSLTCPPEEDSISSELAYSSAAGQKNVTIYEFSAKNIECYMDNILYASFCEGSRIWCSRCSTGIYTVEALKSHLASHEHSRKIRGNEQLGFMCHVCKIFFIELRGDSFVHTHSSRENRNVIEKLGEQAIKNSIGYNTPINKSLMRAYIGLISNMSEAWKFCCQACYDCTKQKLMYLGHHEVSECHKKLGTNFLFAYCKYCNVVYIDKELPEISLQFKFHFASHISDNNKVINYTIYSTFGVSVDTHVDANSMIFKNVLLRYMGEYLDCKKLSVRYSKNFFQFLNPGITLKEFVSEEWDNVDFTKYLEIYTGLTGNREKVISCLMCNLKNKTENEMIHHLFKSDHHKLKPKHCFLKICDVCSLVIISESLNDLQQHFNERSHIINMLSKKLGVPVILFDKSPLNWFINMSKNDLGGIVDGYVNKMKLTFLKRKQIFTEITKDAIALLSEKFPTVAVTFYGSRVSGLAIEDSDFDIYLNLGIEHLGDVTKVFTSENDLFKLLVCLSGTPVPIIKARHKSSGNICDFNLKNCQLHHNTSKIVKIFTDIDERVLWLLAAVRHWSDMTKLRNTGMFSSHAITWLVLFYLMQPDVRVIPTVSYVIEHYGGLDGICYNEPLIWKPKGDMSKEKTAFDLLEGFFNYYFLLKFSEYKLCPLSGLVISRNPSLPGEDCPMFMQDPLDHDRNILFRATKEKCEKLTAACYLSLHLPWRL